jgi:hypothetical protein
VSNHAKLRTSRFGQASPLWLLITRKCLGCWSTRDAHSNAIHAQSAATAFHQRAHRPGHGGSSHCVAIARS